MKNTIPMSFEKWSETNQDELDTLFAENGADREMCFDREVEEEKEYNKYLKGFTKEAVEKMLRMEEAQDLPAYFYEPSENPTTIIIDGELDF